MSYCQRKFHFHPSKKYCSTNQDLNSNIMVDPPIYIIMSFNLLWWFFQVLTAIGNFCICSIAVGMVIEIIVIYGIQERGYRVGIDNLLVLLIGGIPIAMPTVLSVTMAIGSHRLSQQVCVTKNTMASFGLWNVLPIQTEPHGLTLKLVMN